MAIIIKTSATIISCPGKLLENINNDPNIIPVCRDIRVDAGINLTFDFSADLTVTEELQLDTLISNLICDSSLVQTTVDQITGVIIPMIFSYSSSTFNRWLSYAGQSGLPSNSTNAIVPFNCKLIGIGYTNKYTGKDTDIEIHSALFGDGKNDSTKFTWELRSTRVGYKTNFPTEILFSAGERIGIFCKRIGWDRHPNDVAVILYLQITDINNEEQTENYSGDF